MKHSCAWASHMRIAVWDRVAEQVRLKNQNGIKNQRTAATILKGTASQVCSAHLSFQHSRDKGRRTTQLQAYLGRRDPASNKIKTSLSSDRS